ncbi:unnamed protein product, partial [Scytosiphon promiscuus]
TTTAATAVSAPVRLSQRKTAAMTACAAFPGTPASIRRRHAWTTTASPSTCSRIATSLPWAMGTAQRRTTFRNAPTTGAIAVSAPVRRLT